MRLALIIVGLTSSLFVIGLSADLLYLYFARVWSDNPIIVVLELILLFALVCFGILGTVLWSKEINKLIKRLS